MFSISFLGVIFEGRLGRRGGGEGEGIMHMWIPEYRRRLWNHVSLEFHPSSEDVCEAIYDNLGSVFF